MAISITPPVDLDERLATLVARTRRNTTDHVLDGIGVYLEDLRLAEQRLADAKAGKSESTPLDVVARDLRGDAMNAALGVAAIVHTSARLRGPVIAR